MDFDSARIITPLSGEMILKGRIHNILQITNMLVLLPAHQIHWYERTIDIATSSFDFADEGHWQAFGSNLRPLPQ